MQRVEFIETLAAITSLYPDEVSKIAPGPNKAVKTLLWNAAAAHRLEFYLNNTRMRYMVATQKLSLLPAGTASNELLHAEINNWFRQAQAGLHQSAPVSVVDWGFRLARVFVSG